MCCAEKSGLWECGHIEEAGHWHKLDESQLLYGFPQHPYSQCDVWGPFLSGGPHLVSPRTSVALFSIILAS